MGWIDKIKQEYSELPVNGVAYEKTWANGLRANISGMTSGALALNPYRLVSPAFSMVGDACAAWTTSIQNKIEKGVEEVGRFGHWAAYHPLTMRYAPKISGSGFLIASACNRHNWGEGIAGGIYLLTNTLASFNKKPGLMASSALSGAAACSLMGQGIYGTMQPFTDGFDVSDILAVGSSLANFFSGYFASKTAIYNSRIDPQWFKAHKRELATAELAR